MGLYTDKVRDKFTHPTRLGVVENPNGIGEVGNLLCGDTVKISFRMGDDRIEDAKFQTYGCIYSVACAQQLTETLIGKSLREATKITAKDVINGLDGVPDEKAHCADMAVMAWKAALKNAVSNELGFEFGSMQAPFIMDADLQEIKPQDDRKKLFSISQELQEKHRIAEMFDEWFIPEMAKQGVQLTLEDIDVSNNIITIQADSHRSSVTKMIAQTMETYFNEKYTIKFAS